MASHLASLAQVGPAVVASFFGAGICVYLQPKLFNHRSRDSIPSFASDWKLEEEVRLRAMTREGAPETTVVCDPIRRG